MILDINDIGQERVIRGSEEDDHLSGRTVFNPFNNTIIGGKGNDTLLGDIASDNLTGDEGDDILQGTFVCPPSLVKVAVARPVIEEQFDTLTGGTGQDRFILGEFFEGDSLLFPDLEAVYYSQQGIDDYALITDFNPNEDIIQLAGEATDYSLDVSPLEFPEGTAIYLGAASDNEVIAVLQDTFVGDFSSGFNFVSDSVVSENLS